MLQRFPETDGHIVLVLAFGDYESLCVCCRTSFECPSMEDAINWVIEKRRLPVERKQQHPHEASETRAAMGLRKLRREKAFNKLPATTREALDKVSVSPSCSLTVTAWLTAQSFALRQACLGWDHARPRGKGKTREQALLDAEVLKTWCSIHNSGKPVTKTFNPLLCDDEEGHRRIWPLMRY